MSRRLVCVLGSLAGCEALGTALLGDTALALLRDLGHPATPRLDPAVGLAAAGAAWLVLTWLVATTALAAAAQWAASRPPRGRPARGPRTLATVADRCSPVLARRIAAMLLGASLAAATGSSAPALAHEHAPVVDAPAVPGPSGVGTLDRPAADPGGLPGHRPGAGVDEVVVRRGDTLWGIAARHLGPASTAADVAAEWPRWYAANRGEIGPDPDLLHPGQRLRPPTS